MLNSKVVKIDPKIIVLPYYSKSVTHAVGNFMVNSYFIFPNVTNHQALWRKLENEEKQSLVGWMDSK